MRGFTLVEVVVGLVLLEVCVVGVAGLLTLSSRTLREAEALEMLVAEAEGVLDSLRTAPVVAPGAKAIAGGEVAWRPDGDEIELVGVLADGRTALRVRARSRAR